MAGAPPGAETQSSPGLTATATGHSVALTLSNGPSNWWFRINWWGTCTAVSGTTLSGIGGYTGGPHSVWAYSDGNCSAQIASTTFTVPPLSFTATVDTDWSVDLTLSNGPNSWWFRIGSGTCTAATGTTVSNIRGYAAGTHIVVATSDSGCSDHVATTAFTISTAALTTTVNDDRSVDLALNGGPHNWWFRINKWGTCTAASGTSFDNIRGYAVGTHSVMAYADSGCNWHVASSSFTIAAATLTATVDTSDWSVDLALSGGPSNWWFRINSWGSCTAASGTSVGNIRGYRSGTHAVAVFPTSNCGSHGAIAGDTFVIPTATLTAAVDTDRSFDLTLSNGPSNWWFRIDYVGTCTPAAATTVSDIGGYAAGTHVVWAYSDSGCTYPIASLTFTIVDPITLTVSDVGVTTATLTIANHSGNWYYQDAASDAACEGPVGAGTSTKDLTSLSAGTSYTYSAYSDSTCTTANRLTTAAGFTTLGSVSSLTSPKTGESIIDQVDDKQATAFTVGTANTGGYVLKTVTIPMKNRSGSGGLTVTLHAMQGTGPYSHASTPVSAERAILSGTAPTGSSWTDTTWTCSGSGCELAAGDTYFIVASYGGSGSGTYAWAYQSTATQVIETATPSNNGWDIGYEHYHIPGSGWFSWTRFNLAELVFAYAPSLDSSAVTASGATLTLSNYPTGDWYYKATAGPHASCQGPVTARSTAISGLSGGTSYTYSAYSDSTCTDANKLAEAPAFSTP